MDLSWNNKLEIFSPLKQATRCLDQWLAEEARALSPRQKQRAAALIARYFHHEDELTDALILSFLRHYSGRGDVDMEDPTSVRQEIKSVLDRAQPQDVRAAPSRMSVVLLVILALTVIWEVGSAKISRVQQDEMKNMVREIVALDPSQTYAAVWAGVKGPLDVRSYQQIPWWRYAQGKRILEKRKEALLLVRARM